MLKTRSIVICLIGFVLSTKIMISPHDIFLGFLAGFFQVGFGFIFITIGARTTPSAKVGIIMLSESVLGPIWVWMVVKEQPSIETIQGGIVIILTIAIHSFLAIKKTQTKTT